MSHSYYRDAVYPKLYECVCMILSISKKSIKLCFNRSNFYIEKISTTLVRINSWRTVGKEILVMMMKSQWKATN